MGRWVVTTFGSIALLCALAVMSVLWSAGCPAVRTDPTAPRASRSGRLANAGRNPTAAGVAGRAPATRGRDGTCIPVVERQRNMAQYLDRNQAMPQPPWRCDAAATAEATRRHGAWPRRDHRNVVFSSASFSGVERLIVTAGRLGHQRVERACALRRADESEENGQLRAPSEQLVDQSPAGPDNLCGNQNEPLHE